MDRISLVGVVLGVLALVGGQMIEGGHPSSLFQLAAGVIVLGGTAGATLLSVSSPDLRRAMRLLPLAFLRPSNRSRLIVEQFSAMAMLARKDGIVAIEEIAAELKDPFTQRAVAYVVDGTNEISLRYMLEQDLESRLEADRAAARVFETAGGYAPTIGILGAVLGLIHAMESLSEPADLGRGIAVAFVATIYGVGLANLLLLPLAAKLRRLIASEHLHDEMVIEGAIALQAGLPPRAIRSRLEAFLSAEPSREPAPVSRP